MRRERNDGRHRTACPQEDILFRIAGAKKKAPISRRRKKHCEARLNSSHWEEELKLTFMAWSESGLESRIELGLF
jgi:hypothetical protein